jgi:hypothetical protein
MPRCLRAEVALKHGVMLFLPEEARRVRADGLSLTNALKTMTVTCLIDTPTVKEEYRDAAFRRGPKPAPSDGEVIPIELVGEPQTLISKQDKDQAAERITEMREERQG